MDHHHHHFLSFGIIFSIFRKCTKQACCCCSWSFSRKTQLYYFLSMGMESIWFFFVSFLFHTSKKDFFIFLMAAHEQTKNYVIDLISNLNLYKMRGRTHLSIHRKGFYSIHTFHGIELTPTIPNKMKVLLYPCFFFLSKVLILIYLNDNDASFHRITLYFFCWIIMVYGAICTIT